MEVYTLKVRLLSDTVFGSGYSVPGFIDADVLYDEYGFPYIKGKTIKGKLGEMAVVFINMIKGFDECKKLGEIIEKKKDRLFGVSVDYNHSKMKISDCEVSANVRNYFNNNMEDSGIKPLEVLEALTHVDFQTSINENGVADESSLRNFRVINRDLELYSTINIPDMLDEDEKILLASSCSILRHLGAFETKGKGKVLVSLLCEGKDVTDEYIKLLEKKVNKSA